MLAGLDFGAGVFPVVGLAFVVTVALAIPGLTLDAGDFAVAGLDFRAGVLAATASGFPAGAFAVPGSGSAFAGGALVVGLGFGQSFAMLGHGSVSFHCTSSALGSFVTKAFRLETGLLISSGKVSNMISDADIIYALGESRIKAIHGFLAELRGIVASAPETAFSVVHTPVRLKSRSGDLARREFAQLLENDSPGVRWATVLEVDPQGNYLGRATLYPPKATLGTVDWFLEFNFFDVHSRIGSYWLTTLWRALELTEQTVQSLATWHPLVAAACSRSLLEGIAAFHANSRKLVDQWDNFKREGKPSREKLEIFQREFLKAALRPQYATRINQVGVKDEFFRSPNVLSYITKISKEYPQANINEIYEWLCDAVHPSFGSTTAFTIERGGHSSKTHFVEVYARKPFSRGHSAIKQSVAWASADAIIVAQYFLLQDLALVRRLLDDIGLTSGVAFGHPTALEFNEPITRLGSFDPPTRNDACPCNSGRKFKKCGHEWGLPGI
jgi:hypothetical protein